MRLYTASLLMRFKSRLTTRSDRVVMAKRAFLLFLFFTVSCLPALAEIVELDPVKDNTLYENSQGLVSNGAGTSLFAGRTAQGDIRRALLAFNLSNGIPADSTVNSVSLTLNMNRTQDGNSRTISVHRVLKDWGEGTSDAGGQEGGGTNATTGDATWIHTFFNSSTWSNPGGDFVSPSSASREISGNGSYTWESNSQLVADVQNWVDDPTGNFGWVLIGGESSSTTARRFNSRESSSSSRPKLTIDFTAPAVEDGTLTMIFPQFVNGAGNASRIILRNNSATSASGRIRFNDTSGNPTSVPIDGQMVQTFDWALEAWGSLDIKTDGTGALQVGIVEVFSLTGSDSDLEGTEIFSVDGNFVSVVGTKPRSSQQVYVTFNAEERAGVAIYNPSDETTTLNMVLLGDDGAFRTSKQLVLQPGEQKARFIDEEEFFKEYLEANPGDFSGTLNITVVSGEDVALVGLIQKRGDNPALLAVPTSTKAFTGQ